MIAFALFYAQTSHLAPIFFAKNDGPFFGADTVDTSDAMRYLTFDGDMKKHLLFSVFMAPLVRVIHKLFFVGINQAIIVTLGLVAAFNVTLAWLALRLCVKSTPLAFGMAAIYALSFANLVFFSIPETYLLSNSAIIAFFWLLLLSTYRNINGTSIILGATAGAAGLLNPPLLSLLILPIASRWIKNGNNGSVSYIAIMSLTSLFVFCLPYVIIHGASILDYSSGYANKWASVYNLFDIRKTSLVVVSFFLFSVVSPFTSLAQGVTLNGLVEYIYNPLASVTLFYYVSGSVVAIWKAVGTSDKLAMPILIWIVCMLVFYVYFNPKEAFLYSSQILFPMFVLIARGVALLRFSDGRILSFMSVLVLLMIANNIPVVYAQTH